MQLKEILAHLESIAPLKYAESWDNVGLLVGDPSQDVHAALVCIDYTQAVAVEAKEAKCDLIVAYHPPMFEAVRRIASDSLIHDAIRRGVAIYSPHTAYDVAPNGTNDFLADVLMLKDRSALRLNVEKKTQMKIVVFVPTKDCDRVAQAMFAAGAGGIGNYTSCSFRAAGTGTFLPGEKANPAIGQAGKLEQVEELRLEMLLPISKVDMVVSAMRKAHPYEEPAFDLISLEAPPTGIGQGRIGFLPGEVTAEMLAQRIKRELGVDHLLMAGDMEKLVKKAAVCAGAGGEFISDAIAQKADLYLTGEIRHHDALRAVKAGMAVICALHSNSERAALKRLVETIALKCPGLKVQQSSQDRDPFSIR